MDWNEETVLTVLLCEAQHFDTRRSAGETAAAPVYVETYGIEIGNAHGLVPKAPGRLLRTQISDPQQKSRVFAKILALHHVP
jgi:hypothetical protein